MMHTLAKIGFHQSYTYFTWRNTKWELEEYLTELVARDRPTYMRPNFFVNTPDILHEYLQYGGPPAFKIRAVLAATLSPTWGVYAGYELFEHVAVRPAARSTSTRRSTSSGPATGHRRPGERMPRCIAPAQRDPPRAPGAAAAAQPHVPRRATTSRSWSSPSSRRRRARHGPDRRASTSTRTPRASDGLVHLPALGLELARASSWSTTC